MLREHVFQSVENKGIQVIAAERIDEKCGHDSIFAACRRNDVARVKEILRLEPTAANVEDFGGSTPIQVACMLRCYETVEILLEHGAQLLKPDPLGVPALSYIKETDVRVKLQRLADAFSHDDEENFLDDDSTVVEKTTNVIRDAAYRGDMVLIDALLSNEPALLSSCDKKGHTPLIFACMGQQADTACYLLEKGANMYATTTYGWQPARFLNDRVKREKVVNFAFKVSPEGRAQAAAALRRRKEEQRLAISDTTSLVMEDIRRTIMQRESVLQARAQALQLKVQQKTSDYIEIGTLRAVEKSIRDFMDEQERLAEEERLRLEFEEAEKVREREMFIAASVAAVHAQRAAEAAAELERQRLHQLALEEEERLRLRLEGALIAKRQAQRRLLEEETRRAEEEFERIQDEVYAAMWARFRKTRPIRVKLLRRMTKSLGEASKK